MRNDDHPLTIDEITQLIDISVLAIYERAYNEAIDDVLKAYAESDDLFDIIQRIKGLKKECVNSTSTNQ